MPDSKGEDQDKTQSSLAKSKVKAKSPAKSKAKAKAKVESLAPAGDLVANVDKTPSEIVVESGMLDIFEALLADISEDLDNDAEAETLEGIKAKIAQMKDNPDDFLEDMALFASSMKITDNIVESVFKAINDRHEEALSQAFAEADSDEQIEALKLAIEDIALRNIDVSMRDISLELAENAVDASDFDLSEDKIADIVERASQIPDPRKILASIKAEAQGQKTKARGQKLKAKDQSPKPSAKEKGQVLKTLKPKAIAKKPKPKA
jgi:hypothetical protein